MIAALIDEGFTPGQIGTWLGHTRNQLQRRKAGLGVTMRTTLALKAIWRRVCE